MQLSIRCRLSGYFAKIFSRHCFSVPQEAEQAFRREPGGVLISIHASKGWKNLHPPVCRVSCFAMQAKFLKTPLGNSAALAPLSLSLSLSLSPASMQSIFSPLAISVLHSLRLSPLGQSDTKGRRVTRALDKTNARKDQPKREREREREKEREKESR